MREVLNQAFAYVLANYNWAALAWAEVYGVDGYGSTGLNRKY